MPRSRFRQAVVAGASMAGLVAARVLSDHFTNVVLVEPDRLPLAPQPRKGVPQGRHIHILLPRGHAILETLFPGLTEELCASGALILNGGRDLAWYYAGRRRTHYDTDLTFLSVSRPLLERHVARRVAALPNVDVLQRSRVGRVRTAAGAVCGADIGLPDRVETLDADLVVDATGRGSALPAWLDELGCGAVATDTIPTPLTYATCQFRRADGGPYWQALLVNGPAATRAGFCLAIEDGRWLVTLASLFDEPSPRGHADFLSFAASLPVPELHEAIADLEPLSDVVRHRFPGSQRRRYEHVRAMPAGLLAMGDAACSFNPVYGQGMTVALIEGEALAGAVAKAARGTGIDRGFTRRWHRDIARIVDVAWQGVAVEDFRFPELRARRPRGLGALQWYMERIHRATHSHAAVTDQFYRVVGFLDPPSALFRPWIAARALLAGRG